MFKNSQKMSHLWMDSNVDILRESSKFKARFARISIAEYEHSEGNQMYNFSCLLVCNLTCVRLERAFGGVPTVAKLSVKLITQYVEITLGSEIVLYGRFHRFCSCQRLSLARLQGPARKNPTKLES